MAVLEQVPVNETRQWVLIRSENATNPIVLFVHGGPGTAQLTLMRKNTQPLEKYFTVVNWDQRRAGKSFAAGRADEKMTRGQFVDDLVDLSSYLAKRFHKDRILLVGHSWGSVIGLLAASKNPDLFSAYVGIGQPPYTGSDWRSKFMTERRILGKHGGENYGSPIGALGVVLKKILCFSREYTMVDRINFFRGSFSR